MKVNVNVKFEGNVEAEVPDHLSKEDAKKLAKNFVLARILATTENVDAPEEDAFDEYFEECSKEATESANKDWDETSAVVCTGNWNVNIGDVLLGQ